jgi:hypothetical protein
MTEFDFILETLPYKVKAMPGQPMTQEEMAAQLALVNSVAEEAEYITEENEADYL